MPSNWFNSRASENPICTVSARSSAVSRLARNKSFQCFTAAKSLARQASIKRNNTGASIRPKEYSSRSPIQFERTRAIVYDAGFDRGLESLRITECAHGQRRAGKLQQAHEIDDRYQDSFDARNRLRAIFMDAAGSACLLAMTMAMGVSARLGFEGRNDAAHRRAEATQHVFEHRVLGDAQKTIAQLAVATWRLPK